MKQRSALNKSDGFQGTGHWFRGHTSEIRKIEKVNLLKTFPCYFKFDYWQTACETIKAFSRHKRIEQVHRKVLAIHINVMSNSINRETVCHRTCILEMTGIHNMAEEDYACLFLTHISMVNSIRRLFFWIIKSLAENTTWQDRI